MPAAMRGGQDVAGGKRPGCACCRSAAAAQRSASPGRADMQPCGADEQMKPIMQAANAPLALLSKAPVLQS